MIQYKRFYTLCLACVILDKYDRLTHGVICSWIFKIKTCLTIDQNQFEGNLRHGRNKTNLLHYDADLLSFGEITYR